MKRHCISIFYLVFHLILNTPMSYSKGPLLRFERSVDNFIVRGAERA